MRYLIKLVIVMLVSGCVATQVKVTEPLNKVGIIVNINKDPSVLCYGYTGMTIFQNSSNDYRFENPLSETIKDSLTEIMIANGVEPVLLDLKDIFVEGSLLKVHSWDGSQSVRPEVKDAFTQKMNEYSVNAVFVYELNKFYSNEKCGGIAHLYSDVYGLYVSAGVMAFLTREGDFSENIRLISKVNSAPLARQPKELSKEYIKNLENIVIGQLKSELSNKINLH